MAKFLWVKNKHEKFTAKFSHRTTNLVHPLVENQYFASSVQILPCPGWTFPAPSHSAPNPLTDPITSRYLTSADLYLGG